MLSFQQLLGKLFTWIGSHKVNNVLFCNIVFLTCGCPKLSISLQVHNDILPCTNLGHLKQIAINTLCWK